MTEVQTIHRPWLGLSKKHASLAILTVQNTVLIMILHYSRVMPLVAGHRYLFSTAVFLTEVLKLGICLSASLFEISRTLPPSMPATSLFTSLWTVMFAGDSWKLAIPAVLYTLQNSLQYVAISNLDAATFQVTFQLKILATALFSVVLLGKRLSSTKWFALLLLTAGVAIVQWPSSTNDPSFSFNENSHSVFHFPRSLDDLRHIGEEAPRHLAKRSATYEGIDEDFSLTHPRMNHPVGLAAIIVACFSSGLAGVYFESILKNSSNVSFWIRNVQLSFFSLFPALFVGVVMMDGEKVAENGFFAGYNLVVWTAILLQSVGGILVAVVVNFADNIAKNFATSISILASLIASIWFFDFKLTSSFIIGATIVMAATYLYSMPESVTEGPVKIARYERIQIGSRNNSSMNLKQDIDSSKLVPPMSPMGLDMSTARPKSPLAQLHPHRQKRET